MKPRRILPLQWKLTIAVVALVTIPSIIAAVMMDQIGRLAANFGATEARARAETIEQVIRVYRDLVITTKQLQSEVAQRIAARPEILQPVPGVTLNKIVEAESNLRAIAVLRADGSVVAEASRPAEPDEMGLRDTVVDHAFPSGGELRLTFRVIDIEKQMLALKQQLDVSKQFSVERNAFGGGQRTAFVVGVILAALVAAAIGFFAGRLVTRRIDALAQTARRVSDGHMDARVELPGGASDELVELGNVFNTMLDDLEQTRGQVEYLQRIGAWQDVARRLAHEIKNPLTPIQLAVQQTVSAYRGDDERFKKQLVDTREIVEEEIAGLRRLVDTFRTLGQLPKVEKAPIALAELAEELRLDPTFAEKLELRAPAEPVTVRADRLLLKRVLANLVENGVHAGLDAKTNATVVMTWRAERDVVAILIDDSGKGVAEVDREKIFEPYVTTKATGTGLGLAIARKIAIEHGGELELARDKAPTGGARFVVTLPLRGPEASLM